MDESVTDWFSQRMGSLPMERSATSSGTEMDCSRQTARRRTASPSTLKIADTATIDFGRTSANPVASGVPVAILDVSGAGSLDIPGSLATTGTGRAGETGKATLSVVEGILYATPVKAGTVIVFK